MKFRVPSRVSGMTALALGVSLCMSSLAGHAGNDDRVFNRIATFPVNLNTDIDAETVAEIVDVANKGKTRVYTDSQTGTLGFVDIRRPADPQALGAIDVGGEPTSVAVAGSFALVAVNTSPSYATPSGHLHIVDIRAMDIVATHALAGQPDSVAVSPDGRYAVVVIENERDEDLGNGDFAVVERDNQANTDARIKRVYRISVNGVDFRPEGAAFAGIGKTLVRDLLPDLKATNGMVLEKIESLAVTANGDLLFANDNDGVDDSSGETRLIRVPGMFR